MINSTEINPFHSVIDLSGLIRYWRTHIDSMPGARYFDTEAILREISEATELLKPIDDRAVLDKHSDLVELLLSAVFPPALKDVAMFAAHRPFHPEGVYATPRYLEILPFDRVRSNVKLYGHGEDVSRGRAMVALLYILDKVHGAKADYEIPIIVGIPDENTGLERVFKVELDYRFVDVEVAPGAPDIDDDTKQLLLNNIHDFDLWIRLLAPEFYTLKGIVLSKLIDVTDQEMLSSIKYYLLKRDAVTCGVNFLTIQDKIRALFKMPELQLGIVFFDPQNNIISNAGISEWNSFMVGKNSGNALKCSYFRGSIYDQAYLSRKPVIIEDLSKHKKTTAIEQGLLQRNVKNIVIAPLVNRDKVLGVLELVTPHPGMLNAVNSLRLDQVLPMFTAAIQRVLGDLQNEVRALIQKECTAIHPSVEWKFLEAGYSAIGNGPKKDISLPEIVFNDVYPIFGLADIRNSSTHRNRAIADDLYKNLSSAKQVISDILTYKDMPILRELIYSIENEIDSIDSGLASGSEASIIQFLKEEVNTSIKLFETEEGPLKAHIDEYFESLDPDLGIVYERRKAFEESMTAVNHRISQLIDTAEESAQEIVPHYFEKYKTDGVEYNAYIGQSILREGAFSQLHLKNFRLWQLITMCAIATDIEDLRETLSHPLEIAQLVLVHSEPLSIRFRQDEKRFDVDGAYNVRYEIVKKRIDKAYLLGSSERLTQPGKISIVYSRNEDAAEYNRYFRYLISENYIEDSVEDLELEELQGARGLRALRITVKQGHPSGRRTDDELISEVLSGLEI